MKSENIFLISIIVIVTVLFQSYLYEFPEDLEFGLSDYINIGGPLITSSFVFYLARRYSDSSVFGRSYLALGIGFFFMFLGDATYFVYESILEIDPYPSIADIFYFVFYPLSLYHIIKNLSGAIPFRKQNYVTFVIAISVILPMTYVIMYVEDISDIDFDFYYGLIFVSASSLVMSSSILGAMSFFHGTLGKAWMVLVFAIMLNTVGDVTYYFLELFEQYNYSHPVNTIWFASFMFVAYAVYLHKKAV